eukprot:361114-Chlamydomonas_euryale.AAC.1
MPSTVMPRQGKTHLEVHGGAADSASGPGDRDVFTPTLWPCLCAKPLPESSSAPAGTGKGPPTSYLSSRGNQATPKHERTSDMRMCIGAHRSHIRDSTCSAMATIPGMPPERALLDAYSTTSLNVFFFLAGSAFAFLSVFVMVAAANGARPMLMDANGLARARARAACVTSGLLEPRVEKEHEPTERAGTAPRRPAPECAHLSSSLVEEGVPNSNWMGARLRSAMMNEQRVPT